MLSAGNTPLRLWVLGGMLALLAGCSSTTRWEAPTAGATPVVDETGQPPRSRRGNPAFYEVYGKRYYVQSTSRGFRERGVASWYGRKFHGRPTSSGVPYDMYAMTAAHKTLPLPTRVKVTNLRNRRSVVVMVNDRGPFIDNRVIDMSYAAAVELDMITDGTAMVEVEALPLSRPQPVLAESNPSTVAPPGRPERTTPVLYLQVGAFGDEDNARQLRQRLANGGFQNVVIHAEPRGVGQLYRVRVGPVGDVASYDELVSRAAELNIRDTHLVTHNEAKELATLPATEGS